MSEKFECMVCGEVDFIEDYEKLDQFERVSNKIEFNGNIYCAECFDDFEPQQKVLAKHLDCTVALKKLKDIMGVGNMGKKNISY